MFVKLLETTIAEINSNRLMLSLGILEKNRVRKEQLRHWIKMIFFSICALVFSCGSAQLCCRPIEKEYHVWRIEQYAYKSSFYICSDDNKLVQELLFCKQLTRFGYPSIPVFTSVIHLQLMFLKPEASFLSINKKSFDYWQTTMVRFEDAGLEFRDTSLKFIN